MWTPSRRPVPVSATILTNPSVSPIAEALPFAVNGNFPTPISSPAARALSSESPTLATSGMVKMQFGTRSYRISRFPWVAFSAATSPWVLATCASRLLPVTSPAAYTLG